MKNKLTRGVLKRFLHYCEQTGMFTWRVARTNGVKIGDEAGSIRKQDGYRVIKLNGYAYLAHRLAWLYVHGCFPTSILDHINRDRVDNRISNLREVDPTTNTINSSIRYNNASGIVGVNYDFTKNKWIVALRMYKQRLVKQQFDDFFEACCVRKSAENKYGFTEIKL